MHLTQGTLDTSTTLLTSAGGAIALAAAFYGARKQLPAKKVPALLGMSAFVFLAQMVNCSIGFGFSGHLVGASLLAIFFGPSVTMLSMAAILALQVGFLGDGSWSTLGANFINMGVVAPWVAYGCFRLLQGRRAPQLDVAQVGTLAFASFISIMAASLSVSVMLGGSIAHLLFAGTVWGLLESAIAVAVFALCVRSQSRNYVETGRLALRPLVALACVTLCLLPFSSQQPDGLEHALEMAQLSD
ncbi:energy-coupling factor ABC transporter permease [Coraliomargarita sp. SDUM461003]|uniref:Energy-coupling factor ABC transporter permease n=1 Tax=Thalassobacterium maritimum TaxID=3041265 RepID=A0ABU1AR14_9BACT|nr:energy-coupling factor ABC transporter permease [Coraliomargarita sp. SDUM461003]MDQ8206606.1 energy-coupling factor ABC transporter permease [Coraliomargarita sp. SDUM461003]